VEAALSRSQNSALAAAAGAREDNFNNDEGTHMTTATGPEQPTNPIEAENTNPEAHESADLRDATSELFNRQVVGDDDECPDEPHVHADSGELHKEETFGSFFKNLLQEAAEEADVRAEALKGMTAAEALESAILNHKISQELLLVAKNNIAMDGSEKSSLEVSHADTLILGHQRQVENALKLHEALGSDDNAEETTQAFLAE
jgi:hypothetical protein